MLSAKRIKRKTIHVLRRILISPAQLRLRLMKYQQKKEFTNLQSEFVQTYSSFKNQVGDSPLLSHLWLGFNKVFEDGVLPLPKFNFLSLPVIRTTMFANPGGKYLEAELSYIEKIFPNDVLNKILIEDYVGIPPLSHYKYLTSNNSIRHAYHLARFINTTGADIQKINSFIEWGGGYGNFAKMVTRMRHEPTTYIMIDLPILSWIQWIYLTSIFGRKSVNLIKSASDSIKAGVINILPVTLVDKYELKSDIFVSTWALSESSVISQEYVYNKNWFGAKNLLIAYQESNSELPDAGNLEHLVINAGAKIEEDTFVTKSHYAFR